MIIKNCITESAEETRLHYEKGKASTATEDLDRYITDPSKTKEDLIGAVNCSAGNFSRLSCVCRKKYSQQMRKQVRHIVLSLSPCDNNIDKQKLIGFVIQCLAFFEGRYYIKFAIHTDTDHVHVHILACNTSFVDGKQLEFGPNELENFKLFCNDVAEKFGIKPITQIDSSADRFEVDEAKLYTEFKVEDTPSEYNGKVPAKRTDAVSGDYWPTMPPAPTIINVILPPNMKTSIFPRDDGRYMLSSKPMAYSVENSIVSGGGISDGYFTPQYTDFGSRQQSFSGTVDTTATTEYNAGQEVSSPSETPSVSGFNIGFFMENEILVDNETGSVEFYKK